MAKAKKSTIHICSECLGEFEPKEINIALKPEREYYTLYCNKCLVKLEIKESRPYQKTKVKKEPVAKKATVKKAPVKKAPVKKAPVKKSTSKKSPVKKSTSKK